MSKQRFLVSLITKDNDYQVEQAEAARSKASELGVDAEKRARLAQIDVRSEHPRGSDP